MQLRLFPRTAGEPRPPVGLRVWGNHLYLCGPQLPKYLKEAAKLRAPKFDCKHGQRMSDCMCVTAALVDVSPKVQQKVVDRLRKMGVPCSLEDPGPPQVEGPVRWGTPDEWGVRRSELVQTNGPIRAAYYELTAWEDGKASLWYQNADGGSGPPGLMLVDGEVDAVHCSSVKECERMAERHLELTNQATGYSYEDWDRGGGDVVPDGLIRWRGGARGLPPIPETTFYDVMTFASERSAAKAAKDVSPHFVAVKAKPIRVYQWDASTDGRLKAGAYGHEGQRTHGAWALTPDGQALLTRWSKNVHLA